MCFDVLTNGDALDRPVTASVLAEFPAGARTGLVTAAFVVVASLASGSPPLVAGALAPLALVAGAGAHLLVLLAGIGALRLRAAAGDGTAAAA